MSCRLSVVIPTHDRAELVRRALASVFAQTVPPDEVLVVDDGSSDGTAACVQTEFPDARVLRQEHRGVSAARNRGIREAAGDWVAFLDSDDEWLPEKLERQTSALRREPADVCHCDEIWIRNGRRVNPRKRHAKPGGWIYRACLPLCAISPSAVMIRREVFERLGGFDESLPVCEDYDMWLRVSAAYRVLLVDEPLVVKYGGHSDQLSRQTWGMDRFRVRALSKAWRTLELTVEDRRATLEVLVEKLEILVSGARKRGNRELAARLAPRLRHFRYLARLERLAA